MTRILLVAFDPETVDFSDPTLPAGLTAEKIQAGLQLALQQLRNRGWEAETCFVQPDATAGPAVAGQLGAAAYDCVLIGASVRLPPRRLAIFEAVVNAVRKAAPGAAIALNARWEASAEAVDRGLAVR